MKLMRVPGLVLDRIRTRMYSDLDRIRTVFGQLKKDNNNKIKRK